MLAERHVQRGYFSFVTAGYTQQTFPGSGVQQEAAVDAVLERLCGFASGAHGSESSERHGTTLELPTGGLTSRLNAYSLLCQ